MTTTYAQRARQLIRHAPTTECEESEISEIRVPPNQGAPSPRVAAESEAAQPAPAIVVVEAIVPLDGVIAASEAGRHSLEEIEERLSRLTARALAPEATAQDHLLVRDWGAIRAAKLAGRESA
jgi:hypothetical protein